LTLVDPTKKTLLLTKEEGDVSAMAAATRYHTIDEATFAAYFTLSPSNDACSVDVYQIYKDNSTSDEVWPSTDARISLEGSLGSFELQVDKTITGSDAASVFLRATTMGMIEITQELEFEVCSVNDIIKYSSSVFEVMGLNQ